MTPRPHYREQCIADHDHDRLVRRTPIVGEVQRLLERKRAHRRVPASHGRGPNLKTRLGSGGPCLTNCLTTEVCSDGFRRTLGDWVMLRLTSTDVHGWSGNA